jgi:hypothetical protein
MKASCWRKSRFDARRFGAGRRRVQPPSRVPSAVDRGGFGDVWKPSVTLPQMGCVFDVCVIDTWLVAKRLNEDSDID